MRKNIIILSLILVATLCLILVMVSRSGSQNPLMDSVRVYGKIHLIAEDTIRFPGRLYIMDADSSYIYGYANKEKALYCYDVTARRIDTLLHTQTLLSGILTGVDRDPATNTFYFFSPNRNRIYSFHPGDGVRDSLDGGNLHLARGEKCFAGPCFLIRAVNYANNETRLKKVDYRRHWDTTLYDFATYPDAGISADGFFRKDPVSRMQFYIPYYNSEVIQYDEANNKVSKIITIDKTLPQNNTVPTGQGYTISSRSRMINMAAASDSGHLFLLSYAATKGKNEPAGTVVDVYSTQTGSYVSSLQFPYVEHSTVTLLASMGDRLLVAFGNNIIRYKIQYR